MIRDYRHVAACLAWLTAKAGGWLGGPASATTVEVAGLYWHFIDVAWIVLLPLLYLSGHHALADLHF